MSSQQLDEEAIFHTACKIENLEARAEYLDQICAGDVQLRERVEALLEIHEKEAEFLNSSPEAVATVDHTPISESPGTAIGRYKLMEQIGEGGMGTVFVAQQERPIRRKVALKVIKPGMDSKAVVARFEAERQALALMDHPNIAKVLDAGTTDTGRPYFVMELVRGIPITEYCDEHKLTLTERLELFTHVCQAIQHAHQKAIIHRDIKPSNVLVTEQDGKAVPKVIDFGVAKALNQRLTDRTIYTSFAQVLGTPLYMSPEQAALSAVDVDTRSDVYSLGVLLYELLTGTTPFDRQRFKEAAYEEIRRIVREEEPPKPSTKINTLGAEGSTVAQNRRTEHGKLGRAVRGDLDWIVMKALEKDRTRRYETAAGFEEDLRKLLHDEPVSARPPSSAYRLRKFVRRNRGPVAAAVVVVVGLIAGTLVASTGLLRATSFSARLEEKVLELQAAKDRLANVYFEQALAAAMSGNESKASEVIQHATALELLSEAQIKMLRGQQQLYSGDTRAAYRNLIEAGKLAPDSILPAAMLATAYALGDNGDAMMIPLTRANAMAESPGELMPLETLFLGQARFYENTESGWDLLQSLPPDYRSPLGDAIMADALTHRAHENHNIEDVRKALQLADAASPYIPDNAYLLMVDLWAHIVAMRLSDPSSDEYATLQQEGREVADRLKRHARFSVATWCRLMFFYEVGDFDTALSYESDALELGDGFMVAVLRYRQGDLSLAEKLLTNPDHYGDAWNRVALAYTVGFDPRHEEEIKRIYEDLIKLRRTYAKWFLPEMFLLFQADHAFRHRACEARVREPGLSKWEISAADFIGGNLLPDEFIDVSRTRLELSRAHLIVGIHELLFQNRDGATKYLDKCAKMKMGNEWYWADAILTRMSLQPDWRSDASTSESKD